MNAPYYFKGDYFTNLKSSNKKVSVSICSVHNGQGIRLTSSNFSGTTKISFKYHETYYSFKYVVLNNYYNPAKLFKVGNTRYTHGFNSTNEITSRSAKINKTLKIDAKTGWIITKVTVVSNRTGRNKFKYYYPKKSSFSSNITLYEIHSNYVEIWYKHKRTGKTVMQKFSIQ